MLFGLTNTPSTFQFLMNEIFQQQLRKFILVFFYDILVYSPDYKSHVEHLKETLEILKEHKLIITTKKCVFTKTQLEYWGHIVSAEGVKADPSKVKAMVDWPKPKNLKALRGFLGLTGYYRRFVRNYGKIAALLTALLKKDAFNWGIELKRPLIK